MSLPRPSQPPDAPTLDGSMERASGVDAEGGPVPSAEPPGAAPSVPGEVPGPALEDDARVRTFAAVAAIKLVTLLVFAGFASVYPAFFDHGQYIAIFRGNHGQPPASPPDELIVFRTFDAEHYLALAEHGYDGVGPENAFYPLYPLLVGGVARVTRGDPMWVAIGLSFALGLAATMVIYDLVRRRSGARIAGHTALLLALQPAAFFTVLPYSESLFLLLIALLLACLERERFVAAGLLGAAMALTRPVGVFALAPLALALASPSVAWSRRATVLLPLVGWAAYFGLLSVQTGDPGLGFAIQRQFVAAPSAARLLDPLGFLRALLEVRRVHGFVGSALDRAAFLAVMIGLGALVRRGRDERPSLALSALLGVVPAVTTAFMSYVRYASVIFPVFEALARALDKPRRGGLRVLVLLVFAALQLGLMARHATFRWAG